MSLFASFSFFSQSIVWNIGAGVFALFCALVCLLAVSTKQKGTEKMEWAARSQRETALLFLRSATVWLFFAVTLIALVLYVFIDTGLPAARLGQWQVPLLSGSFLIGVVSSVITVSLVLRAALFLSARTAQAARTSLHQALRLSAWSASLPAWICSGFGLMIFGAALLLFLEGYRLGLSDVLGGLFGLALGAALVSFVMRVAAGLSVQMLALSPRRSAVESDLNDELDHTIRLVVRVAEVLDLALASILAVMVLALSTDFAFVGTEGSLLFPFAFAAVSILVALPMPLLLRTKRGSEQVLDGFRNALFLEMLLLIVGTFVLTQVLFHPDDAPHIFAAVLMGILLRMGLLVIAEQSLGEKPAPLAHVALTARKHPVNLFLSGLSFGHVSILVPLVCVLIAMLFAWLSAGIYGIAVAALGSASVSFVAVLLGAFEPVTSSARSVVAKSDLPKQVTTRMETLSAAGREVSAVSTMMTTLAAFLTALSLFFAFTERSAFRSADLADPIVLAGLLFGALLPLFTVGLVLNSLLRCRDELMTVYDSFLSDRHLLLKMIANKALRETCGTLAVLCAPLVFGLIFGVQGLGGMLVGALVSGAVLSLLLLYASSAWNAEEPMLTSSNHHEVAHAIARIARDLMSPVLLHIVRLLLLVSLAISGLYLGSGIF